MNVLNSIKSGSEQKASERKTRPKAKSKRKEARKVARKEIKGRLRTASAKPLTANTASMFQRAFTERDASRLGWMLTVCDPFGSHHWSVPPTIGLGVPLAAPRIYRITLKGFASANADGMVYVGANADMWLPDAGRATLTNAQPRYGFLGNNPANGGTSRRGSPVHYTTSTYAGCIPGNTPTPVTGSNGYSWPGPTVETCTGLNFCQFPDSFINIQLPGDPGNSDAYQRAQCIATGLRVRPTAPASGALIPQGVVLMTQQTLGDSVITCASAASGTLVRGGADVYAYLSGVFAGPAAAELTGDMIAREEWDVIDWPRDEKKGEGSWLTASAIPNQSCCLAAYAPKVAGDRVVGYPQLAAVGAGMRQGQVLEFEAAYVYAFYGGISYEINAHQSMPSVPQADLSSTVDAAATHMAIGGSRPTSMMPARQAVAATVQPAVSSGEIRPSNAAKWIQGGKDVIESVTGSSIGDLIGEGLGFLAGALL